LHRAIEPIFEIRALVDGPRPPGMSRFSSRNRTLTPRNRCISSSGRRIASISFDVASRKNSATSLDESLAALQISAPMLVVTVETAAFDLGSVNQTSVVGGLRSAVHLSPVRVKLFDALVFVRPVPGGGHGRYVCRRPASPTAGSGRGSRSRGRW